MVILFLGGGEGEIPPVENWEGKQKGE